MTLSHLHRSTSPTVEVGRCSAAQRREALDLLFGHLIPGERSSVTTGLLEGSARGKISLDGLLVAKDGNGLRGTVWAQLQPGRTAVLWPPKTRREDDEHVAAQLLDHAVKFLAVEPVVMAQVLLKSFSDPRAISLQRLGFFHLTDLLYLRASTDVASPERPTDLDFEPFQDEHRERFATVIEQTYEQTQDCPALNGLRDLNDVLVGYQATGVHHASRWMVGRCQHEDVGVLLLTDHPSMASWELIYMGIVPVWRGRGLGAQLVQHSLRLARAAGREYLVLGVDAQNRPALEVYQAAGFETWDRRAIYLKRFDP